MNVIQQMRLCGSELLDSGNFRIIVGKRLTINAKIYFDNRESKFKKKKTHSENMNLLFIF